MASKEIDTGVVHPTREIVESKSELKEEARRLKQQMTEIYHSWIRGHPPPSFPTKYTENPTTIPPLTQAQVPTTVSRSPQRAPGFTPYHNYPGTSSQIFHALPAKTTTFPAPDTQYYTPEPTFKVPDPYSYTPHFEPHVETEKPLKNAEKEEIFRKVKSLEQSLRNM
uniref:Mucin-2-like n=1 Tax=Nicotiana sylvestris TaxID=4096 RepID=A0A1U7UQB8_NICSY|nr:PREDICTED: mucin-2-like [Nicotiana sylvestris]